MKIKEVMKTIEKLNELRKELGLEKAYVNLYIDDIQVGKDFHTLNELVFVVKEEYINDFWRKMLEADYTKTYNNTLSTNLEWTTIIGGTYHNKVELFIDC